MKDILDIKDVANIEKLENEYDLQKASLLERKLRLMTDENPDLKPIYNRNYYRLLAFWDKTNNEDT
jgi:uncharacterized Ntn-hydrolase superfamily protein